MIIKGYIFTYLYLILVLLISTYIKKKTNDFYARKFVHIFVGFVWIISYIYFGNKVHIIIPPLSFIIINYIAYKKQSNYNKELKSLGTIYYPLSVFIMALTTYINKDFYPAYAIALFSMSLGDGVAPLVAKQFKTKFIYNNKTIIGSASVFILSLFVVCFFNNIFILNLNIVKILIIAVIAALLELIGTKGLDNIYLPLGVFLLTFILERT